MPLIDRFQEFQASIGESRGLIAVVHQMNVASWKPQDTQTVTQAAFLKSFIAWETFLERSLIDYMRGERSAKGTVILGYAAPADDGHASKMLVGTQKYVDYSNPDIVRKLAKLYFRDGQPYESVLSGIHNHLFDLKTIRNAAAHLSSSTTTQLDALASRLLGPPQHSVSVYGLLTAIDPNSALSETVLETYLRHLDSAAFMIANA